VQKLGRWSEPKANSLAWVLLMGIRPGVVQHSSQRDMDDARHLLGQNFL
jgi:hypothetical protein